MTAWPHGAEKEEGVQRRRGGGAEEEGQRRRGGGAEEGQALQSSSRVFIYRKQFVSAAVSICIENSTLLTSKDHTMNCDNQLSRTAASPAGKSALSPFLLFKPTRHYYYYQAAAYSSSCWCCCSLQLELLVLLQVRAAPPGSGQVSVRKILQ